MGEGKEGTVKECKVCGKKLKGEQPNTKYCSEKCYETGRKRKRKERQGVRRGVGRGENGGKTGVARREGTEKVLERVEQLLGEAEGKARENLLARKEAAGAEGAERRQELLARCSEDPVFWIDHFVWQYNPSRELGQEMGPFVVWDFQKEALVGERGILWCVEHKEDLVIEKSREMGASWLCLLAFLHGWFFRSWRKYHMISRNEEVVESANPDSLFWKLDFVLRYIPGWMMPEGYNKKRHRKKKILENPANGSVITGEASTGKAGVGGRATAMFVDEFPQIREDYEVYDRTSDTTKCRIFNGTHRGTGTCFYELTKPDSLARINRLVMHWSEHPQKWPGAYRWVEAEGRIERLDPGYHYPPDFQFVMVQKPTGGPYPGLRSPWYDEQCGRKRSPRAVAMDLDIDPAGSVSQVFDAMTIRELIAAYCVDPYWEGDVALDQATGRPVGLVKLAGGPLKLWILPRDQQSLPADSYGVGCDLSTGLGATNSCVSAISATTGEKVAEYATPHVRPEYLAPVVVALCWLLKSAEGEGAKLAWEDGGPGQTFGKQVMELGYGHIHYREGAQEFRLAPPTRVPGWYPTPREKRLLLEEYRAALDMRKVINRSEQALRECLAYRYNSQGQPEHPRDVACEDPTGARVNHGDRTTADALAWKMARSFGAATGAKEGEGTEARPAVGSLGWRRQLAARVRGEDTW